MVESLKKDLCLNDPKSNKVLAKIDYFLCAILALVFTAASYYMENADCNITLGFIMSIAVHAVIFIITAWLIRKYLSRADFEIENKGKFLSHFEKIMENRFGVFWIAGIIFIFWLPTLVFLYPGTLINDTWGQLQQFMSFVEGNGGLWDHHPIFDTLLMGILIVPLAELTGRWHMVIFGYVLLQSVITSMVFSCTVKYVYKQLKIGNLAAFGIMLMYCVLPFFPASVQTVSKDALFSWIFVLFLIYFVEIIRSNGKVLRNKKFLFVITLLTILCCLTKKVGMYVVLLSLLFVFTFLRKNRKYMLVPIGCSCIMMFLVMPFVCDALDVSLGGKQEMFSLPFQQTARYVKYYGYDMTEEERQVIDNVLTIGDLAERYDPYNADPVKLWYQKGSGADYVEYIKVWIKQGIRHPGVYISAFVNMLAGWFSWSEYDPLMNMNWHNLLNPEMIPEWVPIRGFSALTANAYQEMYHNLYNVPILRIFLSYGFYASLIPAFVAGTVFRKNKNRNVKYWLGVLPMILSIVLGCWLAPVSVHIEGRRYLYPLTYTAPLMLAWCVFVYKNNKKNEVQL